jgi:hypothetical protein
MMNNSKYLDKGKLMNKSHLIAVLTLTCLLGLGISARAQDSEGVIVKVPFEFVAGAKTMPADTYSIGRISSEGGPALAIRSYNNGAVLLLPIAVDGNATAHAQLRFEHVGDRYFLKTIETPGGVYTITTPRAITTLAQMKAHSTSSSSGTN